MAPVVVDDIAGAFFVFALVMPGIKYHNKMMLSRGITKDCRDGQMQTNVCIILLENERFLKEAARERAYLEDMGNVSICGSVSGSISESSC